ncbi:MAG: EAL domain-containing protein [Rhizobiaceae bacterium]
MRGITPTLWLSFGLTAFTLAVTLLAYMVGLVPDGKKVALDSRAKIAESLAIQLVGAVNRNDAESLEEVLTSIVSRNDDVLSGAVRLADGKVVFQAGDHQKHWVKSTDSKSTSTHVTVPLMGKDGLQGTIELSFVEPAVEKQIFGVPASMLMYLGFLMSFGFFGYFILLRRTLRQLDPGRVIPERVQKAFDTLSEGVIIVDEKQRMLLVNKAFAQIYGGGRALEPGKKINNLSWRMVDGRAKAGGFPWYTAIKQGKEVSNDLLSLRTANEKIINFDVSTTVISDEKDKTIGAIITLADSTRTKLQKAEFEKAIDKLALAEEEVQHYRHELQYAKTHDVLTGCLNRQEFVRELERRMLDEAGADRILSTLSFKIDHLSQLNRTHGVAHADKLLASIANSLELALDQRDFVGRLNAGVFCIALPGITIDEAKQFVPTVNEIAESEAAKLLPASENISLSMGLAQSDKLNASAHGLLNRCLVALDEAKLAGGDNIAEWSLQAAKAASAQALPNTQARTERANRAPSPQGLVERLVSDSAVEMNHFLDSVDHTLAQSESQNTQLGIIQISIDSWDYLSEAVGVSGVQNILGEIKHRCASCIRANDHLVSLYHTGDILIRVSEIESQSQLERMIDQILTGLQHSVMLGDQEIYVSPNAGIALFPENGATSTVLLRNAGTAMRRARQEGLAKKYRFYSVDMIQGSQERLIIESGIRDALRKDEFELHFQPIINAETATISAAECLLRSNSKRLKGFRIDQIIDVAEMSLLSLEVDKWVMKTALAQIEEWDRQGVFLPKISINISAHQLTNTVFMDHVFDSIKNSPVQAQRVQIEVTETARMAGVEIAATQIKRLQQLGVIIALDDFGTGQASLMYLQRLHPDLIKIDRSFVDGVHTNHANATLVSATTVMAHSLGLKVVAEGVEQQGELEFLCNIGCDEIQGYLFAKPMSVVVMTDWIKNSNLRALQRQQVDDAADNHSQLNTTIIKSNVA